MTSKTTDPTDPTEATDTRAEALTTLIKILTDIGGVEPEDITVDSRLSDDLAISSLNLIEAVVNVEDTFGVRIEDNDVQGFTTVGDLVSFIETNRAESLK